MSLYRRAKKEVAIKQPSKEISVSIGSIENSFESLKTMCNDKSNELIKTIELEKGEEIQIVFWTEDIPELIGVAKVIKNDNGLISYSMDYSLTTL